MRHWKYIGLGAVVLDEDWRGWPFLAGGVVAGVWLLMQLRDLDEQ